MVISANKQKCTTIKMGTQELQNQVSVRGLNNNRCGVFGATYYLRSGEVAQYGGFLGWEGSWRCIGVGAGLKAQLLAHTSMRRGSGARLNLYKNKCSW